ncbi:MAG: DUF3710 domain-containing protein [Actinomycetota bacterium]|nr:DUF3710 domain-containing protein [Actinomycetota bacterium]
MFRRRKREQQPDAEPQDEARGPDEAEATDASEAVHAAPARPRGPWDVDDVPDPDTARVDLGSLQIPVPPGVQLRIDMSPEGEVIAATMEQGEAQMMVNAFAAPRSEGIWQEVRDEIRASLLESGGRVNEQEGPFGPELQAVVRTEVPGQGVAPAPARFVGVDGPRWFLRALFSGAAAVQPEAAAPLEDALRQVVVVRGTDPMAVRDPLPLRLPREVAEQAAAEQAAAEQEAAEQSRAPQMPERGPEITETR